MNDQTLPSADDERYGTFALIRRLLAEQGLVHWRKYAFAFSLMAISAACTALSAYLIGDVINQAYVNHESRRHRHPRRHHRRAVHHQGPRHLRPQRDALADRQPHRRRQSARASSPSCSMKGLGFFSDRHSTEFIARLSAGAAAATQVINLLITSLGRDLLSLIGLLTVMVVQDPLDVVHQLRGGAAGVLRAAQADPPHLRHRAQPVPRRHPHHRDAAGNAARHPHRQGLHARRHHARALRPQRRGGRARGQQDGARLQPRQPADGNAGRLRDRDRHHLWRLSRDRDRSDARAVLFLHRRLPAGL